MTIRDPNTAVSATGWSLRQFLPFLDWLVGYDRRLLSGDLMAGVVVAIMLVPQSMAYALLAGLPPQVGLYASIVPLVIYGLLGTSRVLAVGPVAMVSLLVASGVSPLAEPGSPEYVGLALTLALMVAVIQTGMGLLRAGFLVNFLSHPVLSGFTSAAALVIGASQIKHVLGVSVPRTSHFYETVAVLVKAAPDTSLVTLGLGLGAIVLLLFFKQVLPGLLRRVPERLRIPITRSGPLVVVLVTTLLVWGFRLDTAAGVSIVGTVPAGPPALTLPIVNGDRLQALLPTALAISLVGYMESIAIARSLAARRRQKVDPNQELVALGVANLGAALTGGYPVTGGLSRSVVNFSAGANSGLASIITAALVGVTILLLTPLFYYLPNATLAAIILVAVASLFDWDTLKHTWHYSRLEGLSLVITFAAVLVVGIENGILVGATAALVFYLWRTSRPHVAIVGRVGDTEHFRNVLRHNVSTVDGVVALRIDESLYFPNAQFLEQVIDCIVADEQEVRELLLIASAVNYIDTSALHALDNLIADLQAAGVGFSLAEVKGPVMDRLKTTGFVDKLGPERIYLSTHAAMDALAQRVTP